MVRVKEIHEEGTKGNLIRVLKGSILAIGISLVLLIVYSGLLTYTKLGEGTIPAFVIIITSMSILISSIISNTTVKKNGLTNGAFVGLIYMMVFYLISSIISGNFGLTTYSLILIIASILSGGIGGIVGVNR